jgi:hypothetical protein
MKCLRPVLFATGFAVLGCGESGPTGDDGAGGTVGAGGCASNSMDARAGLLAAFDHYEVVAADSPTEFYLDLVRHPDFPKQVNDIVVECGNSLYQPLLDRYIAGEDVPLSEVRQVWRNTTQVSCGFSSFYEQLLGLIRGINERLLPGNQLRVLAPDPPVDWNRVTSLADLEPFGMRDASIASIMKEEVLSKQRKALMLFGVRHLLHGGKGNAVGMYEQDYPNLTFVVAVHHGFAKDNDALEQRLTFWPSLTPLQGSWLGELDSSYYDRPAGERGYPGVDAYLYLGPHQLELREPLSTKAILDSAYLEELRRRAAVRGAPSSSQPDAILQREADSGVLVDDPANAEQ